MLFGIHRGLFHLIRYYTMIITKLFYFNDTHAKQYCSLIPLYREVPFQDS